MGRIFGKGYGSHVGGMNSKEMLERRFLNSDYVGNLRNRSLACLKCACEVEEGCHLCISF